MANELRVQLRQVSVSTSEATIRGTHKVLVDRPTAKGGADAGPMGGELFLAAIGGCFMSNMLAAIKARDANVSNVQAEVTGTIVESPARFESVEIFVSADGADRDQLEKLVEIAERGCIMVNTLRDKLDLKVRTLQQVRSRS